MTDMTTQGKCSLSRNLNFSLQELVSTVACDVGKYVDYRRSLVSIAILRSNRIIDLDQDLSVMTMSLLLVIKLRTKSFASLVSPTLLCDLSVFKLSFGASRISVPLAQKFSQFFYLAF